MKFYYINENYRILKRNKGVNEGGLSRNIALMMWIQKNISQLEEIRLSNNRLLNVIRVLNILIRVKKSTIFFQYTTVGIPLFNTSFFGKIVSNIFLLAVRYSLRYNEIIFDVSDIKYEQAIDLEIYEHQRKRIQDFENKFFMLNAKFVFASYSMRDYAIRKFDINRLYTDVLVNGGNRISKKTSIAFAVDEDKVNFVYAGTLNKGRRILEMVEEFPENSKIQLYLLGNKGEWIDTEVNKSNITYLGSYTEEEAHQIVSLCDIGLIPYDEEKRYYNIAYPTKLSFYITAGISFLSTPVNEVKNICMRYNIGHVITMNNWSNFYSDVEKKVINLEKSDIQNIKNQFLWDIIISNSQFIGKYKEFSNK